MHFSARLDNHLRPAIFHHEGVCMCVCRNWIILDLVFDIKSTLNSLGPCGRAFL